jgi:hypothetical protein
MVGGRVASGDLLDFGNGFVGKIRKDKYSKSNHHF